MGGTSPEETRGGQGLCGQTIYLPLISLVSGEGVTTDSCNLVFNISVAPVLLLLTDWCLHKLGVL